MSSCHVFPIAQSVANAWSGHTAQSVTKLLNEAVQRGIAEEEDIDKMNVSEVINMLSDMMSSDISVDVNFNVGNAVNVASAERFTGDIARSRRATHYISFRSDGQKSNFAKAYDSAGRSAVEGGVAINEDTVAVVEMTTSSDMNKTMAAVKAVLDAGGRVILPSRSEVQTYASSIESDNNKARYVSIHTQLEKYLEMNGYSIRDCNEFSGRVVQKTADVVVKKLNFGAETKAGKVKAVSDTLSEDEVKVKISSAKDWTMRISGSFETKEGVSTRAEGITAATMYDAVVSGQVDAIVRSNTKNNDYSQLKPGDVLCLTKDKEHSVYVEVIEVTPNLDKEQYIETLRSGEVTTGYSIESAANLNMEGKTLNIIKIKPIAEQTKSKGEAKAKKQKSSGSGKKYTYKGPAGGLRRKTVYKNKKTGKWYAKWVPVTNSVSSQSDATLVKQLLALNMAMLQMQLDKGLTITDEDSGKELTKGNEAAKEVLSQYKAIIDGIVETEEKGGAGSQSAGTQSQTKTSTVEQVYSDDKYIIDNVSIDKQIEHRHNMCNDIFDGNFALTEAYGESLANKFISQTNQFVIPLVTKLYQEEIDELKARLASGIDRDGKPLSRSAANKIKLRLKRMQENLDLVHEEGWISAMRVPDVMNRAVAKTEVAIRSAWRNSKKFDKLRKENPNANYDTLCDLYEAKYLNGGRIDALTSYCFMQFDQKSTGVKYLHKLFDGYDDELQEEDESLPEEELAKIKNRNADIRKRRALADKLRAESINLGLRKLTDIIGVRIRCNHPAISLEEEMNRYEKLFGSNTKLEEADTELEDVEKEEASDEANDAETYETSERDIQMVANYERDISATLSKKVRVFLSSQLYYEYDEEYKGYFPAYDHIFLQDKRIPAGVVYNKLLRIVNGLGTGHQIRDSKELVTYLEKHIDDIPWAYGVVEGLKKDAALATQVWVAMRKTHIAMRSMHTAQGRKAYKGKTGVWINVAENYNEAGETVMAGAQERISNGIVLERGTVKINDKELSAKVDESIQKAHVVIRGENVVFKDLSIYNNAGHINQGNIKFTDGTSIEDTYTKNGGDYHVNPNGKTVKEVSGAIGLYLLLSTIEKEINSKSVSSILDSNSDVIDKLVIVLKGIGVDCDKTTLRAAFALEEDKLRDCIGAAHTIIADCHYYTLSLHRQSDIEKRNKRQNVYDLFSNYYQELGKALSCLAENTVLGSFVWGSRQYYSFQNRSYLNELLDTLCESFDPDESEEVQEEVKDRVRAAINKLIGYNAEHPEQSADMSFYYEKDAAGNVKILNPWLRSIHPDRIDHLTADTKRNNIRKSLFHNLGYTNYEEGETDVKHMTALQKTLIEIQAYFAPKGGAGPEYALPIMADSSNHIFMAWDACGIDFSSHKRGYLLEKYADIVKQEFNRISAHNANVFHDEAINRPELWKTYQKNAGRFCYFPCFNNTTVTIHGEEMSFYNAMKTLLSTNESDDSIGAVTLHYKGKDYSVDRSETAGLYGDMVMTAVYKIFLKESYDRSIRYWEEEGLFRDDFKLIEAVGKDGDEFSEAKQQHQQRMLSKAALRRIIARELNVKAVDFRYDAATGRVKLLADTSAPSQTGSIADLIPAYTEVESLDRSSVWRELGAYSNSELGIEAGDLQKMVAQMDDIWFLSEGYDLSEEDAKGYDEKVKNAFAEIRDICDRRVTEKDKNSGKDNDYVTAMKAFENLWEHNLLAYNMHEYVYNKTLFKMAFSQILVGDIAQFKNEGDLAKRSKGFIAASEKCDEAAVDVYSSSHKGELVRDYYGEDRIVTEKWKANQKTITLKDFEANAEGTGFYNQSDFFNKTLLPKLDADLKAGIISQQDYADFCSNYTSMNIADGQTFRPLPSMVKLLKYLGLCTEGIQHIYDAIYVERRKLTYNEVREAVQQMKTVSYTFQEKVINYSGVDKNGNEELRQYALRLADFTKDSSFSLMMYTEDMAEYLGGEDSILQGILDFATENQIDAVHFESTKKTGETNILDVSQCKTAKEAYTVLDTAMKLAYSEEQKSRMSFANRDQLDEDRFPRDPANDIFHAEPWANIGRQVSSPEHLVDREQGVGTQIAKLILADIDETWQSSIDNEGSSQEYKTYVTLRGDKDEVEMRLTPSQYNEMVTRITITNLRDDYKTLLKRLGSKKELSKLIIEQITRTNKFDDDLLNAVRYDPETKDFNCPLDNPRIASSVQPILASLVRKTVIKQKTKGGTAIQFSSVGRNKNLRQVWETDELSGQPRIKYVECMLPAWSKALFTAFADKDGNIDVSKLPSSLTNIVGYRVPTEYMYSMVPLRVVGFLEPSQGTSIMLPQEIVVWSGSDSDIDKLYLEIPEFELRHKKDLHRIKDKRVWNDFYNAHPEWVNRVTELWMDAAREYIADETNQSKVANFLRGNQLFFSDPTGNTNIYNTLRKEICAKYGIGKGRLFDIFDIKSVEEKELFFEDLSDYIESNGLYENNVEVEHGAADSMAELADEQGFFKEGASMQAAIDKMSRMERNNLLVKLHFSRLTSDFSLMQVNKPGGFSSQKRLAYMMTVMSSKDNDLTYDYVRSCPLKADDSHSDNLTDLADQYSTDLGIFDAASDDSMFDRNMVGSQMIGICALHNAFHAVIQTNPIELSVDFVKRLGFQLNGENMRTRLGDIRDSEGKSIILNIGGFLAAAVDNAKDPVLSFMNLNPATADTFLCLLHLGYPLETVTLLMNQPIVRKIAGRCEQYKFWKACRDYAKDNKVVEPVGDDNNVLTMTRQIMADALKLDGSIEELLNDPQYGAVQRNALLIMVKTGYIANAIRTLMNGNNVTSPNKSFANTMGEMLIRMAPALYPESGNYTGLTFEDERSNKKRKLYVFNNERYCRFISDNDVSGDVKSVDDYIEDKKNGSLPIVQACYDLGFRRPLAELSKVMSVYGRDSIVAVMLVNNKIFGDRSLYLTEAQINQVVRELRTFRTTDGFFAEHLESNPGLSVSEIRAAFLRSFPRKYSELLQKYFNEGRDLQDEFAILGRITQQVTKKDETNIPYLKFSKRGRIDKNMQNEIINSWIKLYESKEADLKKLAIQLYEYAFFFNGLNYSPVAFGTFAPTEIMKLKPTYNESLRRLTERMEDGLMDRFVDQFLRNHKDLIGRVTETVSAYYDQYAGLLAENGGAFDCKATEGADGKTRNVYTPRNEFYFNFKKLSDAEYIEIYPEKGSSPFLFRKVEDNHYVRADYLGDSNSYEYDPTSDLCEHVSSLMPANTGGPVSSTNAGGLSKKEIVENKKNGTAILEGLSKAAEEITDDRSGDVGNDASAYMMNGKTYMRVHTYMKERLGSEESTIPVDRAGKPRFTQEQWDKLAHDGAAVGSAMDAFARYYFARENFYKKVSWQEARYHNPAAYDAIFGADGLLSKAGIDEYHLHLSRDTNMEEVLTRMFGHIIGDLKRSGIYDPDAGDNIITELNGNSIKFCATVNNNGESVNVGGEIDWLITHADGSFSIVDLKTVSSSSLPYLIEKGPRYQEYAKQLNCYRSLFMWMCRERGLPTPKIRGMHLVIIENERHAANDDVDVRRQTLLDDVKVADPAKGQRTVVTELRPAIILVSDLSKSGLNDLIHGRASSLKSYDDQSHLDITPDPTISGIADPVEEKKAPAQQKSGTSSSASQSGSGAGAAGGRAKTQAQTFTEEQWETIVESIEAGDFSPEEAFDMNPAIFRQFKEQAATLYPDLKLGYDEALIGRVKKLRNGLMTDEAIERKWPGILAEIDSAGKTDETDETVDGGTDGDGDGFNSYRDILVHFLGEEAANSMYSMFVALDQTSDEENDEIRQTKAYAAQNPSAGVPIPTLTEIQERIWNSYVGKSPKTGKFFMRSSLMMDKNELANKDDAFFQSIADAFYKHKKIKDDTGSDIC